MSSVKYFNVIRAEFRLGHFLVYLWLMSSSVSLINRPYNAIFLIVSRAAERFGLSRKTLYLLNELGPQAAYILLPIVSNPRLPLAVFWIVLIAGDRRISPTGESDPSCRHQPSAMPHHRTIGDGLRSIDATHHKLLISHLMKTYVPSLRMVSLHDEFLNLSCKYCRR